MGKYICVPLREEINENGLWPDIRCVVFDNKTRHEVARKPSFLHTRIWRRSYSGLLNQWGLGNRLNSSNNNGAFCITCPYADSMYQRFSVGGAIFEAGDLCYPCLAMERNLGKGGIAAMIGQGGLCLTVVKSGEIKVGDAVVLLNPESV